MDIFPVSPDGAHVGAIQYSTNATIEIDFDDYYDRTSLYQEIDSIPYAKGMSRIDRALKKAQDELFQPSRGHRPSARKVSGDSFISLCFGPRK